MQICEVLHIFLANPKDFLIFVFFKIKVSFLFFFVFMNGNTERAKCALSQVCIP